jgi:hypothetical protein
MKLHLSKNKQGLALPLKAVWYDAHIGAFTRTVELTGQLPVSSKEELLAETFDSKFNATHKSIISELRERQPRALSAHPVPRKGLLLAPIGQPVVWKQIKLRFRHFV